MLNNEVARFYRSFLKRAPEENRDPSLQNAEWAMLMTMQHLIDLNYYDRNRYDDRLRRLEAVVFLKPTAITDDACPAPPPL